MSNMDGNNINNPYGAPGSEPQGSEQPQQTPPPYGQPGSTPYGQQPGAQPYGQAPYGGQPYPPHGAPPGGFMKPYPDNGLAGWSLGLAIASIVLSCGPFTSIPAIILGAKARKAVVAGTANNGGMATTGFVIGWIMTVLWILGILFFIWAISTGISDAGGWEQFMNDLEEASSATTTVTVGL